MPRTYGSAKVFFVSACITIPQSVSPAPTINAVKTLGVRISQIIDSILLSHVGATTRLPLILFAKNPITSPNLISTLPNTIDIAIDKINTASIINIKNRYAPFDSSGKKCFLNFFILSPKTRLPQK